MRFIALLVVLVLVPLVACLDGDTFTVNCSPLTQQRSDPIIFPSIPSAHVHAVIGGNAFQRTMGPTGALKANSTTCDKGLDHSNYWVPQLYHQRSDGMFEMVKWNGAAVYYQKRACDYSATARVCDKSVTPLAFPDGFRMVAGDPSRRSQNNSDFTNKAIAIMCIFDGGSKEYNGFPPQKCNTMRAEVYFPSCWDGKNLDSPNHQSHVSYPAVGDYNGGVCPQSHPVALLSIFYEFFFDTSPYTDINRFAFANGDPTGFGYHGDFIMGWTNRNLLQTAHRDCVGASDCPTLINQPSQSRPLIFPAVFEEDIGLHNPIKTLPGNNPVHFANANVQSIKVQQH
jgi:hypothetical protein